MQVSCVIRGADHICHLGKMSSASSVTPYEFEPKRCENTFY